MVGSHRKDLLPTILRQLHTLKGNSSLYSLVEIKDKVHQVEMQVKEQMKGQNLDWTGLHKDLSDLTDLFEKFLKSNQQLLGLALDAEDSKVELSYPLLTKLYQKLQKFLPNDLSQEVSNEFFYIPAAEFIRAYPEYAEELAVRLDKKLAPMEIVGGDIKVKKNVYDDFFLSLIHLLRNSLDHGLETVAERQKSGKSPEGHIRFTVKHENNDLIVQFEDDGRGLDTKKILKDVQANDPETQKAALIKKLFYEGTSTKTEVTDISGQGAGLAAVGLIIDKLKGKIDIDFNRKVGASFIFRFPYV
jgi:two-component system chemotaxis sensor kinase CheA